MSVSCALRLRRRGGTPVDLCQTAVEPSRTATTLHASEVSPCFAECYPIDRPVDGADKAGAAHDVAQRDRHEVVEYAGDGDERCIEISWRVIGLDQQPRQWQEIHVGHAMLETGGYESRDRQHDGKQLVGDRSA